MLTGPDGERVEPSGPVEPETVIHIPVNYPLTLYLAPVTTILGGITAIINFYQLVAQ